LQETRAARTFSTRCSRRALFLAFRTELLSYNKMDKDEQDEQAGQDE
jgi:hypothetical protein